jgi:hypothetical protein
MFSNRALMMEAARTSETSVDNDLRTRQYIPEDSEPNLSIVGTVTKNTHANRILQCIIGNLCIHDLNLNLFTFH